MATGNIKEPVPKCMFVQRKHGLIQIWNPHLTIVFLTEGVTAQGGGGGYRSECGICMSALVTVT
jgi:hypothetical protein